MRLIDADALMPNAKYKGAYDIVNAYDIAKAQTIDAVPVVRCKDCKHWREETDHTCRKWGCASPRRANGYCDECERKES